MATSLYKAFIMADLYRSVDTFNECRSTEIKHSLNSRVTFSIYASAKVF